MKRTIALILTIALLLTACTSTGETAQGFNVDLFDEGEELSGTLTISADFGQDEFYGWSPLVEGFKELHPNVEVTIEHTGIDRLNQTAETGVKFEQYRNDLNVSITSGNSPDLIFTKFDYASNFVPSGMVMDLNVFIEKDPSFNEEDFYMNVLEAFEIKDGLYSMPNAFTYDFFRLRTDVLENAGYDPDELETIDYKILLDIYNKAVDSGEFPELLSIGPGGSEGKAMLWNLESSSAFNLSEMTANYDSPEFIEYLELTRAYDGTMHPTGNFHDTPFEDYLFDESYFAYDTPAYVGKGNLSEIALTKTGVTDLISLTSAKGELYVTPLYLMSIPTNAKNPALAWEFIKYCTYESDSQSIDYSSFTAGKWSGDRFEENVPINKNNLRVMVEQYLPQLQSEIREEYISAFEEPLNLPIITKGQNVYLLDALQNSMWYDYYQTEGIATAEEVAKDMQEKAEIYFREIE